MLSDSAVEPLLAAARTSDAAGVLAALQTLCLLELPADAVVEVNEIMLDWIDVLEPGSGPRRELLRLTARREPPDARVVAVAADPTDVDRDAARAGPGPPALDVGSIVRNERDLLRSTPDVEGLRRLACLPIEDHGVRPAEIRSAATTLAGGGTRWERKRTRLLAASADGMEIRLWESIALGRLGKLQPLRRVLDAMNGGAATPSFLWGDPWSAYELLAVARPVPATMRALLSSYPLDAADRSVRLVVWALTGTADAEGWPLADGDAPGPGPAPGEPADLPEYEAEPVGEARQLAETLMSVPLFDGDPGPVDLDLGALAALPPAEAAPVVQAVFESAVRSDHGVWAGNALVNVVRMLPPSTSMPVTWMATTYLARPAALPPDQISWVLGRAGEIDLVAGMTPLVIAPDTSYEAASLLVDAVARLDSIDPPLHGAGPATDQEGWWTETSLATPPTHDSTPLPPPGTTAHGTDRPVRTAWPRMSGPRRVDPGAEFTLTVGLSELRDATLVDTGLIRLSDSESRLGVTAQLSFDPAEFDLVEGSPTIELSVAPGEALPSTDVLLRARADAGLRVDRHITAVFLVGGYVRATATRWIGVGADLADDQTRTEAVDLSALLDEGAPDLLLVIDSGGGPGVLIWTSVSPLLRGGEPIGTLTSDLGDAPAAFTTALRAEVTAEAEDPTAATLTVQGVGIRIGELIPPAVRSDLRAVCAAVAPDPATVLLLSAEPYVPWELAVLDPPIVEPEPASRYLGSVAAVGRWVLGAGRPGPRPPRVDVRSHAVVSAEYERVTGWNRLPHAENEAAALIKRYPPAEAIEGTLRKVAECLAADPGYDVIHFALHGRFGPDSGQDGLVLVRADPAEPGVLRAQYLRPNQVRALKIRGAPFVFLNACQVGGANTVLGDYSGMAVEFLKAGAAAVVAPVWNVNDERASALARGFYAAAYAEPAVPPAEILRRQRAEVTNPFTASGHPVTQLAFQFFGHPRLTLRRREEA